MSNGICGEFQIDLNIDGTKYLALVASVYLMNDDSSLQSVGNLTAL